MWLGLVEGTHFRALLDLAGLYRVWNPRFSSWSVFSQDHVFKVIALGGGGGEAEDNRAHHAAHDADRAMHLFHAYRQLASGPAEGLAAARAALLQAAPAVSFSAKNPSYEGVCMGNRKTCTCKAPFIPFL